jgi:hypothetical protein
MGFRFFLIVLSLNFAISFLTSGGLFGQTTLNYLSSTQDFANPERGFYRYSEARSTNYVLLDQGELEGYRELHTPPTAGYNVYSTLVFRYFVLENFVSSEISQGYLDSMQMDFDIARAAGVKLIPRFAYTIENNGIGNCGNWICPPYGDASKDWVLTHIDQIASVLQANQDVIALVQMGFIGVWGEGYYTDHFGDASQPPGKLLNNNWADRADVLEALLQAVSVDRMVQVRYPQMKQRTIYGVNAPTNSPSLMSGEAFTGSNKSRIGFHNDCLLASPDDFGTYFDYGNSSTSPQSDTANLKPYFEEDSRFVVVGGETCSDNYSPMNDCTGTNPAAIGNLELERLHYSYLNAQYNNDVNNDWVIGGCMEEVKRRLGYRIELINGTFSDEAVPGQSLEWNITLQNTGYAAPFNPRGVEFVLRDVVSGQTWFASVDEDPRFWLAGEGDYSIETAFCLPDDFPLGTYEVLLHLPDPMPSLYGRPEYSMRLANRLPDGLDVWESSTGYNRLGHHLVVTESTSGKACAGETTFESCSTIPLLATITDHHVACDSFTWLDGNTYTQNSTSGQYFSSNCDTLYLLDLSITQTVTGTDTQMACENYTWLDGNTYTQSNNTATFVYPGGSINGCDSIVVLDLTINAVSDLSVEVEGATLSANNSDGMYQWVDCDNGFSAIPGATNQSFTATQSGGYAVVISENNCIDTSDCVMVTILHTHESKPTSVKVFPNPASGHFEVDCMGRKAERIDLINIQGQIIATKVQVDRVLFTQSLEPGVYLVRVAIGNDLVYHRLVVK